EVPKSVGIEMSVALYAGSHDLALERLDGILRERGILLEVSWTGSLCGVAALMLNEADIVGIHILDTETGTYNTTYLKSVGLGGRVAIVRGYERLQGFVTRKPMDLEHVIKKLFSGELTLINRRFGSGTRILLDYVLRTWAKKLGIDPESIPRRVRGYDDEASTHLEVAERVARGDADVGMVIAAAAKLHGLNFIPIAWERFDFAIPVDKLSSAAVSTFINVLRSSSFIEILKSLEGYRLPKDMGSIEFI
ncbi:MAG TPA: MolR family transcriptional regulator, partial [Ignisphaera aggregans]|nr:MolR family transcriptional regulator [Ignisphaera aggregans]